MQGFPNSPIATMINMAAFDKFIIKRLVLKYNSLFKFSFYNYMQNRCDYHTEKVQNTYVDACTVPNSTSIYKNWVFGKVERLFFFLTQLRCNVVNPWGHRLVETIFHKSSAPNVRRQGMTFVIRDGTEVGRVRRTE
jgi:hypothetical protein